MQSLKGVLAEIQSIGNKIDACNNNLTEIKQTQVHINTRLDHQQ